MARFTTVAVAGKGQLGNFVVSALSKAGFNVTVLTRSKTNPKDVPTGTKVVEVDYASIDSLTEALKGQDVVVGTLAMDAITVQHNLLKAAITAGVERFIPSEYSGITLDPKVAQLPPMAPVMEVQRAVKEAGEKGEIEYTIVAPGGFLNLMFNQPILLDWDNKTARLYDGGEQKFSVSRLSTIARVICGVLAQGEAYKNRIVRVHDGTVTQKQFLQIAQKEKPEAEWKVVDVDVGAVVEDGMKKLAEGTATPEVIGEMMIAKSMAKDVRVAWTEEELENERLGIKGLDGAEMEELMRKRARGEWVDVPKPQEGAWRIDIK